MLDNMQTVINDASCMLCGKFQLKLMNIFATGINLNVCIKCLLSMVQDVYDEVMN